MGVKSDRRASVETNVSPQTATAASPAIQPIKSVVLGSFI